MLVFLQVQQVLRELAVTIHHGPPFGTRPPIDEEIDMRELDMALTHITDGTTYSWDLTILISLGIPVSSQLRQRLLAGSTTKEDADQLRALLRKKAKARGS
jgi:hypothetical protein